MTSFYTAPTLIRSFVKVGDGYLDGHDLSSLRVLGTVGEPINPEAWLWYRRLIGKERCPIVEYPAADGDGWDSHQPAARRDRNEAGFGNRALPRHRRADRERRRRGGAAQYPRLPRRQTALARDATDALAGRRALLRHILLEVLDRPCTSPATAPGRTKTASSGSWGESTTSSTSRATASSTTEIESTLVEHPAVAEAAATGAFDPVKGQQIVCFVLLKHGRTPSDELASELRDFVGERIGRIARPAAVLFGDDLPKTRSGKIMRRLAHEHRGRAGSGDTTTLRDPGIVDDLKQQADAAPGRSLSPRDRPRFTISGRKRPLDAPEVHSNRAFPAPEGRPTRRAAGRSRRGVDRRAGGRRHHDRRPARLPASRPVRPGCRSDRDRGSRLDERHLGERRADRGIPAAHAGRQVDVGTT